MKNRVLLTAVLLLFSCSLSVGQKSSGKKFFISGYVTDVNNNPVQGAMILVDKKNTEVLTDNKGFFRVKAKPGAKLISVFSIKLGSAETEIGERSEINFKLAGAQTKQASQGEEEKVNIGYGTANKKDVTSQVNKVKGDEDKYASYSNIYEMLKGTCPGVQVIGKEIRIQGQDFHNGNPLMVVDGVIVNSVDDIQPVQVRSVEILKGAAASIYGSRGAGGVILIHLKGTSGK